jgi:hypothetical protein
VKRTLKQHYYPEGGWGYVILIVTLFVQLLVHGLQFGLGSFINGVDAAADFPNGVVPDGAASGGSNVGVVARRLVYGGQRNASKNYEQNTGFPRYSLAKPRQDFWDTLYMRLWRRFDKSFSSSSGFILIFQLCISHAQLTKPSTAAFAFVLRT